MANNVLAVAREKIAALIIQPQRQMPALVFVSNQLALKTNDKAFGGAAITGERKGDGPAFDDVSGSRDFCFGHSGKVMQR